MTARTSSGLIAWRVACSTHQRFEAGDGRRRRGRPGRPDARCADHFVDVGWCVDQPIREHHRAGGVTPRVDLCIGARRPGNRMNQDKQEGQPCGGHDELRALSAGQGRGISRGISVRVDPPPDAAATDPRPDLTRLRPHSAARGCQPAHRRRRAAGADRPQWLGQVVAAQGGRRRQRARRRHDLAVAGAASVAAGAGRARGDDRTVREELAAGVPPSSRPPPREHAAPSRRNGRGRLLDGRAPRRPHRVAAVAARRSSGERAVGRLAAPRHARPGARLEPGSAAARRADQSPRRRGHRVARGAPARLCRRPAVRHARPCLPPPPGHAHRRARSRHADVVAGRLRQLPREEGGGARDRGARSEAARQEAGRGGSVAAARRQGAADAQRRARPRARGAARRARRLSGAAGWRPHGARPR